MPDDEAVFGGPETVVYEVLVPDWGVGFGEHAEADSEHVHVEEGDVCPGIVCRCQSESCNSEQKLPISHSPLKQE